MSTTTPSTPLGTIDISRTPAVPLGRLVKVEARKAFDTRAGRWFAISIVGLVVVATAIAVLAFPDDSQDFVEMLGLSGGILGYFLPVLMILLVTSEWSQRTGLATFTLEPRRSRVVTAKLLAGVAVSVAVLVIAVLVAAIGTALSPVNGGDAVWNLGVGEAWSFVFSSVIGVFIGFALAMLVRNSPAAIVGYFAYTLILPTVAAVLGELIDGLKDIIPWVELNTAQTPLITGDYTASGQEWAQILTSGLIWLVLPTVLGVLRLVRAEVK